MQHTPTPEQIIHQIIADAVNGVALPSGGDCTSYTEWVPTVAANYARHPFADHQREFWEWADNVFDDEELPRFALLFWPRGHAKSTSAEMALAKWGCCNHVKYALYVCATQELADDHIGSIADILESEGMSKNYPGMATPLINKHGNSKGWRRNRLRTASGFTVDAIGLDTAARGAKMEEFRPNAIILDDIDSQDDSPTTVAKKIRTLTQGILPTFGDDDGQRTVVVMAQNLTHPNAIAKKLDDGTVEMLTGALQIGPLPAVDNMRVEQTNDGKWRIIEGTPTWAGMNIERCHDRIDTYGLSAFTLESQQQISDRKGALWVQQLIDDTRMQRPSIPFDRIIVSIDPNKTGRGDDAGVVCIARAHPPGQAFPHAYILDDRTELVNPEVWRDIAAELYLRENAGSFVIERTGSGDLAELTLRGAPALHSKPVDVVNVEAKLSKKDRARPVAQLYKDGRVHHCGSFPTLEQQMTGWVPETSSMSPGGVDALVHGITHLLIETHEPPATEWVSDLSSLAHLRRR